jgi:hypothetical protein
MTRPERCDSLAFLKTHSSVCKAPHDELSSIDLSSLRRFRLMLALFPLYYK